MARRPEEVTCDLARRLASKLVRVKLESSVLAVAIREFRSSAAPARRETNPVGTGGKNALPLQARIAVTRRAINVFR
jgi:hypothetical protein